MDMIDINSIAIKCIQVFTSVWSSIFNAFQDYSSKVSQFLRMTLRFLRMLNKNTNPWINKKETPSLTIQECDTDFDLLLQKTFIVVGIITFIAVSIRCIWSHKKEYYEFSKLLDSQIRENQMIVKQEGERLREIYKVLLDLKSHLASASENGTIRPIIELPIDSSRKRHPSKSLYSNLFKSNVHYPRNTNLNESLQKTLTLLEEQLEFKPFVENDADETQLLDVHEKFKILSAEPSRTEECEKSNGTTNYLEADDQKSGETSCSECAETRELLSLLQQRFDCAPVVTTHSRSGQVSRKSLKGVKKEDSDMKLRLLKNQASTQQRSNLNNMSSDLNTLMVRKKKDSLNVSADKNALNIEVLFDRDIRLREL